MMHLQENRKINISSKDFAEFIICEEFKKNHLPVVLINYNFSEERIKKNINFFIPNAKILYISNPFEMYGFTQINLHEIAKMIENTNKLLTEKFDFIIIDYKFCLQNIPWADFFLNTFEIKVGEKFQYSKLTNLFFEAGYTKVETVFEFGEFALRGFIVDIGMMEGFYRIEFEGEKIISIAEFNTESQRKNLHNLKSSLVFNKIKEIVLTEELLEKAKKRLAFFEMEDLKMEDLRGFYNFSLHNFLPLFYENMTNIFNLLPANANVFYFSNLSEMLKIQKEHYIELYELYKKEGRVLLSPNFLINQNWSCS